MENGGGVNRVLMALLLLVSLISIVAVIVAAVSISRDDDDTPNISINMGGGSTNGGGSSGQPIVVNTYGSGDGGANGGKKTWLIAIGHDYGAFEYLDEEGYLQGFTKDIITEVCEAGQMDCRLVWDVYINCWDSNAGAHPFAGQGLQNGWYDACSGWIKTIGRSQSLDFSLPFMKGTEGYPYKLKGTDFDIFAGLQGKTVGFMDGWAHDEKCVARYATNIPGYVIPAENVKHYLEVKDAVKGLQDGEVDILFGSKLAFGNSDELEAIEEAEFQCSISGHGMMTRKDSGFNAEWDRAFLKLKETGRYKQLCEKDLVEKHSHMGLLNECIE